MTVLFEDKLDKYYRTGEYNGFYEVIEYEQKDMSQLTFSDGIQEVSAPGMIKGDALQRMLHKIDSVRSN